MGAPTRPSFSLDSPVCNFYKARASQSGTRSTGLITAMLAQVAQLVEHATENRSVAGSIPALGTTHFKDLADSPQPA